MRLARLSGEVALVFGVASMNPIGLGIAALGAAEIGLVFYFEDAAQASFERAARKAAAVPAPEFIAYSCARDRHRVAETPKGGPGRQAHLAHRVNRSSIFASESGFKMFIGSGANGLRRSATV